MKRGITVATISIVILVIVILFGTITINYERSVSSAKKTVFALEISSIQEELDRYMSRNFEEEYPIYENAYTLDLSNVTSDSIPQFKDEKISGNKIILYEIDLDILGIKDRQYGNKDNEKDVYVLSKETGRVYYLEGVKYNNKTYYTITSDLIDLDSRSENKKDETVSYENPVIYSDDSLTIKNITDEEKEIYLSNIDVSGEKIKFFKYEIGIIEEENAKSYFSNNGKNILGDRIKLIEETNLTLYAENINGGYAIKHINLSE